MAAPRLFTKPQLEHYLGLPPADSPYEDVQQVLRQERHMLSEDLKLVKGVMRQSEITKWYLEDDHNVLLFQKHYRKLSDGKTIVIPVVCASFASMLAESISFVPLQFYCSHHSPRCRNHPQGPLGLLRSLIWQLLSASDDVLSFNLYLDAGLCNAARYDNIKALCDMFDYLISMVSRDKAVVCLIDEAPAFDIEYGGWNHDMTRIAVRLQSIVSDPGQQGRLKVMLSSAGG